MKKIGLLLILLLASPAVAQPTFDDLHGSRCSNQRDLLDVLSDQQLLWTEGRGEPGSVLFHVYDITHSSFGDSSITI
ncbi:MAG TPA: hypothetical protein VG168_13650, partial [Bryobacteraceae bacterium]|nr:hypothetical protein [Bryobacteraceae bacterium]